MGGRCYRDDWMSRLTLWRTLLKVSGYEEITRGAKAVMLTAVPKSRKRDQVLGVGCRLGVIGASDVGGGWVWGRFAEVTP